MAAKSKRKGKFPYTSVLASGWVPPEELQALSDRRRARGLLHEATKGFGNKLEFADLPEEVPAERRELVVMLYTLATEVLAGRPIKDTNERELRHALQVYFNKARMESENWKIEAIKHRAVKERKPKGKLVTEVAQVRKMGESGIDKVLFPPKRKTSPRNQKTRQSV